jgi:triacylglycerol esterase/lipase EstA (alpha/beta hydrolase family)
VLVHGLGATMGANWNYISPILKRHGYCVFALTYGVDPRFPYSGGVIPIEQSAQELKAFVARVRSATGAAKVDLVGHSEGTFMPQYWLKFLGGAAETDDYVAMTPLYDGTNVAGLAFLRDFAGGVGLADPLVNTVAQFCGSCPQFLRGSPMVKKLQEGGKAAPGVRYHTIMTKYDELVSPYTSGRLPAPAENTVVQDVCPNDVSEHVAVATDPVVAQLILNALEPSAAKKPPCSPGAFP